MTTPESIDTSIVKKFKKTIWNQFIKGVKEYELIKEGDRVTVCISGGKDSMLMAKCMQRLQKYSYVPFEVEYLVMDPGYNEINRQKIVDNAALLELPIKIFETKIFDIYFSQLFKKDYPPEDVQALFEMHRAVMCKWIPDNPMGLNESLLAMKAYAPFHHLYAISVLFAEVSNKSEMVPRPSKVLEKMKSCNMVDTIINITGKTLNRAFKNANSKYVSDNKVFSPQNWIKSKASIITLTEALRVRLDAMEDDESSDLGSKIQACCKLDAQDFESRWTAD